VQWNGVRSQAGVLRGVHVHLTHADYLAVVHGCVSVGMHDLRLGSPTWGVSQLITMSDDSPAALSIPPGVAHGFYFHCPSYHVYAVSHYWDPADELGCRWDDPALGIPWPATQAQLSLRDQCLPSLRDLQDQWSARFTYQATFGESFATFEPVAMPNARRAAA
jgi:dTDP-4-dehydrorhamnose 3,5-epimerase